MSIRYFPGAVVVGDDDDDNDDNDDDDDDDDDDGFREAGDTAAQVKLMDDATLLRVYRALSNPKVLDQSSNWISLLEQEIRTRGLMPLN
jgi:hypothetical protein